MKVILLDAGPLGLISNPNISPEAEASRAWLKEQVAQGTQVFIAEIADYEVRRELLRANKTAGVTRLDLLKQSLIYAPLTTSIMLKAAEFWAQARQMGKPAAHNLRLDADMIIAAQAALFIAAGHEVVIATSNVSHLSLFVPAARWQDIK